MSKAAGDEENDLEDSSFGGTSRIFKRDNKKEKLIMS